ncbi:MAG: two-component system response regulator LytT [Paraglaciecola sp.]|jgi:two-component system response regulator LytT
MKVLLIEDEYHAQKRLTNLLKELRPNIEILAIIDSVEDTVLWLKNNTAPDLMFLDIQLSDGLSFEIFTQIDLQIPVIFTTAFDEYAIKAFKINSVDYLLKPLEEEELEVAINKFENLFQKKISYDVATIQGLMQSLIKPKFKERFMIKMGQSLSYIPIKDVAYFYSENSLSFIKMRNGKRHIVDYTIDQIMELVNPKDFFRINRKAIIRIDAILQILPYFNNRLVLKLQPVADFEVMVSRERVKDFRKWIDG